MPAELPPFITDDDRDERRYAAYLLAGAARLLPQLARNPDLLRYQPTLAGPDALALPSATDLARAEHILRQVVECLRDSYRQRARDEDDPDPWRGTDASKG